MDPVQTTLADEVREQVRRRRIDPQVEADAVRQLALDVVAEHEKRSLTGAVRSLDEPDRIVGGIVADVAGFGPLQPFLDDPTVEEVWINEPDRVFVARDGKHELTSVILTAAQVRELVERMLSSSGRRLDVSQPSSTRCCREVTACTWSWRASRAGSVRSTSASSSRGPTRWTTS